MREGKSSTVSQKTTLWQTPFTMRSQEQYTPQERNATSVNGVDQEILLDQTTRKQLRSMIVFPLLHRCLACKFVLIKTLLWSL